METRETTFADVMEAWTYGGGNFRQDRVLAIPLRNRVTGAFFRFDDSDPCAVRDARFRFKALSYFDGRKLHPIDVVFDEVTGYIVSSSHELEGYRMKDGEVNAPEPRPASDGTLVFQRSHAWLEYTEAKATTDEAASTRPVEESCVAQAYAELQRQHRETPDGPYTYYEEGLADGRIGVDGVVDLRALVSVIIAAGAAKVRAATIEECAKVAETMRPDTHDPGIHGEEIAAAILALGEKA